MRVRYLSDEKGRIEERKEEEGERKEDESKR